MQSTEERDTSDATSGVNGLSDLFASSQSGPPIDAVGLEKRGRSWLLWSFLLCPCHLPWTLAVLGGVLASTSLGALVRDHAWIAGTIITIAWIAGTGYGFHLIRLAQRNGGACSVRTSRSGASNTA